MYSNYNIMLHHTTIHMFNIICSLMMGMNKILNLKPFYRIFIVVYFDPAFDSKHISQYSVVIPSFIYQDYQRHFTFFSVNYYFMTMICFLISMFTYSCAVNFNSSLLTLLFVYYISASLFVFPSNNSLTP